MKNKVITAFATAACAALLALPAVAQTTGQASAATTAKAPARAVTGTITAVDPALRMVTIKDAGGTDFNLRVNRATKIMAGDHELTLKDLAADVNKQATVRYVQRPRGDIARAIHIEG